MKHYIEYKRLKEIDFLELFILEPIYDNVKHAILTQNMTYYFVEKSNYILNYRIKNLDGQLLYLSAENYYIIRKVLKFIYKDFKNIYKIRKDFYIIREDNYDSFSSYEKIQKSLAHYFFNLDLRKQEQDFCDLMIKKIDNYLLMKKLENKLPEKNKVGVKKI